MPLVITRKAGESVRLDGPGEVKVLELRRNQARLLITAPASTNIVRTELCEAEAAHEPVED